MKPGQKTQSVEFCTLKAPLLAVAKEAGRQIMDVYAKGHSKAEIKKDGSPVTEADRRAESCILPVLMDLLPGTVIISEENSVSHQIEAPERFWLVDPLDGTKEFLKRGGEGAFTVNIALIEQRHPVLGVIFAPALDRLFYGDVTTGAQEIIGNSDKKIAVSNICGQERLAVTSSSHLNATTQTWLRTQAITRTKPISSSFKFCMVATGEADIYPRFGPTMEWDTAAGDAILRAAGGITTTLNFQPYLYGKAGYKNTDFIAWNKAPHQ